MSSSSEDRSLFLFGAGIAVVVVGAIVVWIFVGPWYGVYAQGMKGKAALQEAESSRQIAVLEAKAKNEAAQQLAEADITRAQGSAKAVEILGQQLQANPDYIKYLYVQGITEQGNTGDRTVVYVPTEGMVPLPIAEANRLNQTVQPQN